MFRKDLDDFFLRQFAQGLVGDTLYDLRDPHAAVTEVNAACSQPHNFTGAKGADKAEVDRQMQQRILLNAVQYLKDSLRFPGLPLLCFLRGWGGFRDLRDIAPPFSGWKTKHEDVVALLYRWRAESWYLRGFFPVALTPATWLPSEVINEVINRLRRDGAHDPVAKVRINMCLQVLHIAVIGLWRKPLASGMYG